MFVFKLASGYNCFMTKVVIVDNNDKVIGAVEKSVALKNGLIRRVVRIFIFNSRGELFLQRRSESKDTYPNTWDQSSGGHVDEGENYDQAAKRELKEELGIDGVSLKKVAKFYTEQKFAKLTLKEFSVLYKAEFNESMKLSKREIKDGRWFTLDEIDVMMKDNINDFPPGFIKAFKIYKSKTLSSN